MPHGKHVNGKGGHTLTERASGCGDSLMPDYHLMMLSGDASIAQGQDGAFYQLLARFAPYWQRIDILTPTASQAAQRCLFGNVHVHPAPYHRLLQTLFIRRKGAQLFTERPYHLVVSHDFGFFYNGIGAQWLLRQRDVPFVSEIHHIEGYPIATTARERLWYQAARHYLPWIAGRGAHFRVVNAQVKATLVGLGVPADHIHKLYSLYLDLAQYRPQDIPKPYDLLFIARLASNKGALLILDALRLVKAHHPTIRLAIRGDGALKPAMLAFIDQHNLDENVIFLPRIAHSADMPTLYQSARLLLCASTVEGNPRVTVEAMACGTPVISTRVGIMPELITHGENGLLVEREASAMATAIEHLLNDPKLYARLSAAGRTSVQRFHAGTIVAQYAQAYHRLIEQHNRR